MSGTFPLEARSPMRMLRDAVAPLVPLTALVMVVIGATAACSSCDEAGCRSIFRVERAVGAPDYTLCIGRICAEPGGATPQVIDLGLFAHDGDAAELTILDRAGNEVRRQLVGTYEVQPNGPSCPPTCTSVGVTLDRAGRVRVTDRA